MSRRLDARAWVIVTILCSCCVLNSTGRAEDTPRDLSMSPLDLGFTGLYNLDFAAAQSDFAAWEKQHPDDPVGPVSEAAGFLFSEFNRLGVLEAQFYENDADFDARPKLTADAAVHSRFE